MMKDFQSIKVAPSIFPQRLRQWLDAAAPHFTKVRQQIHAHPELAYQENLTSALIAHELEQIGINFTMGVGGTGVVALMDSGNPGKTVALRADIDALPLTEMTELFYKSTIPGKMHACGHDGHTATLLMAAHALWHFKDSFNGKIKLIFQPAEEGSAAGAAAMIKDGVLENPPVDAIFAYHNHPGFAVGSLQTMVGTILSSNSNFVITVRGKGGHAASQNLNIDPILIGAVLTQNLHGLQRELASGTHQVVISVTEFQGGSSKNIIPDFVTLGGTIRSPTLTHIELAKQKLVDIVHQTVTAYGAQAEINITDHYPPTINSDLETQHVFNVARRVLGDQSVSIKPKPSRSSEDFSFYLEKVPGCYFLLGNGENTASCHNSAYDFNDDLLSIAAELICYIAIDYLNDKTKIS